VTRHPAKFSDALLPVISQQVPAGSLVLDPFAGTGKIHELRPHATTIGVELEPEWAAMSPFTIVGDALHLPFANKTFDAIATSPTYGNRMADHHNAKDASTRNTYRHTLGRSLHPNNSGQLQWGEPYRHFHVAAWTEAIRVLKPGGVFVLNTSDHYRKGVAQPVTKWHRSVLQGLGLTLVRATEVPTPRNRFGANGALRPDNESVITFLR